MVIYTPPYALIRNCPVLVDAKGDAKLEFHTNVSSSKACAFHPAAKLLAPHAIFNVPPGMVLVAPDATFELPPPMNEYIPNAILFCPPAIVDQFAAPVLLLPPAIVDQSAMI